MNHWRIEEVVVPQLTGSPNAFLRRRSTLDAIDLVVKTVRRATADKRWTGGTIQYCLPPTLDIKNAFNSVRWDCIMDALSMMDVPAYLRRFVANFTVLKYDMEDSQKEYRVN